MNDKMTCILSNRIEELFDQLHSRFFKLADDPLVRRLIVVPDFFTASFVRLLLAQKQPVVFGIEFLTSKKARARIESGIVYERIALFGFASMESEECRFFSKLKASFYLLSPCMMFWTDLYSKNHFEATERHRLLANCGRKGRELALLLEDASELIEAYVGLSWIYEDTQFSQYIRAYAFSKKREDRPCSLLGILQTSSLLLHSKSEVQYKVDDSLKIHGCPTYLREVQVLYEEIAKFAKKHPLQAAQCVVMAPDIEIYRPYIERVFCCCGGRGHFFGQREPTSCLLFACLFDLLSLPEKRWTQESILHFFSREPVSKKLGISQDAFSSIRELASYFSFTWGYDEAHRKELLEQEGISYPLRGNEAGTFVDFKSKVMALWAIGNQDIEIESALATSIGLFLQAVDALKKDVDALFFKPKKSYSEWALFIETLYQKYIIPEFQDEEYALLQKLFLSFKDNEQPCSFLEVKRALFAAMQKLLEMEPTLIEAPLVFCSLGAWQAAKAEMVCLIGMNEGAPIEKYHVIEAIMAARAKFHMSYQCFSYVEKTALEPSSALTDIKETLASFCDLPEDIVTIHSLDVETKRATPKREFFFSLEKKETPKSLSIRDLEKAGRSPLSLYFQKNLSLYLSDGFEAKEDPFFASMNTKQFKSVKKEAFFLPEGELNLFFQQATEIYPEVFQKASYELFRDAVNQLKRAARDFGCHPENMLTLELSCSCSEVQKVSKGFWRLPSPVVEGVSITGVLTNVWENGVIHFGKKSQASLFPNLAKLVLLSLLEKRFHLGITPCCHFLEETPSTFSLLDKDPESMNLAFISYATECQKQPMCLYPHLLPLLKECACAPSLEEIKAKDCFIKDPYLDFFLSRASQELLASSWPLWRKFALELFL